MTTINVSVQDKIAAAAGSPSIICGNSDYTVSFTFDSEWDAYTAKTARFRFFQNGMPLHYDILFTGNIVNVPVLHDVYEVEIGVYAGNLHTTTDARVPCVRSITDGDAVHPDPPADLYEQLMELLSHCGGGLAVPETSYLASPTVSEDKIVGGIFPHADFSMPLNLVNGAWVTNLGQYASFQSRTNRVTMSVPCRLPAGKTITFSCPTNGIKVTAALMDAELLVLENISWSDSPLVATNSTGSDVSCIVGFKRSNDADFTPSYLGTVTFTIT